MPPAPAGERLAKVGGEARRDSGFHLSEAKPPVRVADEAREPCSRDRHVQHPRRFEYLAWIPRPLLSGQDVLLQCGDEDDLPLSPFELLHRQNPDAGQGSAPR